jgi:ATP-binding cassette subfamily B protein
VAESFSLNGGFLVIAGAIELAAAFAVLYAGAGGGLLAALLAGTTAMLALVSLEYHRRRRLWTGERLDICDDLVERMVGYRTRVVQQNPAEWHEGEDQSLSSYVDRSKEMDALAALLALAPRLWLVVGCIGLAPAMVSPAEGAALLAVSVGGVLLAHRALKKLTDGFSFWTDAVIAWRQVLPLFQAAGRPRATARDPAFVLSASEARNGGGVVLDASDLAFRYPGRGQPVLRGAALRVEKGDRVLIESPSGGGKSTLVSLLNGLREPDSGLLLYRGLDRRSLGVYGWSRHVASAPQFHENHVLTGTLAFNLLMGRSWPPRDSDLQEAETLCREAGLGDLLDRMPSGLFQIVGESGWRLSHGEKSRLYMVRALLQGAEIVVLDESFGALDAHTLQSALGVAMRRASSLVVVAHP